MNTEVLRKYWVELAIAALAVIALLVGLVLTHHGQAPPDTAATGASATTDTAATSTSSTSTTAASATSAVGKSLPVLAAGTNYYIDRIQHGSTIEHYTLGSPVTFTMAPGETLSITGWTFDGKAMVPASGVFAQVDDSMRSAATYGAHRGDVATVFKNPKLVDVGFVVNVPPSALPPGRHAITLLTENAPKTGYYPARNVMIVTVGK